MRNPAYNASTDSPKARENLPDRFLFTVNSNTDDIYAKIARGDIEDEVAGGRRRRCCASTRARISCTSNYGDRTWYLTMNLTQPPFDDVHVRRAVNFVVNREALRKAWGGPTAGTIATHIAPDAILGNKLKGYAPYGTRQRRPRQGQGRDEAVQVRRQQGRHLRRQGVQEHLHDHRRPPGRERDAAGRSSRA